MKFNYQNTSNISEKDITKAIKQLGGYFDDLKKATKDDGYTANEASLYLPFDKDLRNQVKKVVKEKSSSNLREVMVVGIGGSNLGTWAVYDAISPRKVRLSFYDTVFTDNVVKGIARIKEVYRHGGKVILNLISKSGGTTETIANSRILIKALQKVEPNWQKQVVITTEPDSKFENWAHNQKITILPNPAMVGGRYSVLSAVGLFPLAMAGISVEKLHKGASKMVLRCISSNIDNPALQSATAIYKAMRAGRTIHDLFLFNPDLERLGKWYRQLVGESLGKERNINGKIVHSGVTPTVSIGSTDLHSVAQLYLGGPADKFTTFVKLDSKNKIKIPSIDNGLDNIVSNITGKTLNEIMSAIYQGAAQAYIKRKMPFVEIFMQKNSEEEIGEFLQFKMIETMLLAKLLNINAFDQPNVEEYKKITKKLLENSH